MKASRKKVNVWKILIYAFLCLMVVIYLAPLFWVIISSLKTRRELIKDPFGWPETLQFENYSFSWVNGKLNIAMWNSFLVCVVTLLFTMVIGAMAAFTISRLRWKLSGITMVYIMTGMMIPVHCVLIPLFVRFAKFGLSNSYAGLIIPYLTFSLPTTVFIMTGFFRSIPNELLEAACIDGCNIYRIFFRVCLPLARSGFMVTGLMTFIANWNELLMAMVFISDDKKKTLPVSLSKFVGPYETNYSQMFAAIVIAIIPTIIVYCTCSNQIVDGLTAGAVKG